MICGSVCSGIGAPEVAWLPLGWRFAFASEIEKFPRAVYTHHYPSVPLHGDFTTIEAGAYEPIDLLVGGTPCQSFSVAGKRLGLDDPRGNLALEFLALARRLRPRWLVFENVPGLLSSDEGWDFAAFLGQVEKCGYLGCWRIYDAQFAGVPQRRRRVFFVGYLGDWRPAAAVLFERESLSGHPPPRRETGENVTGSLSARPTVGGGLGTDFDVDGGLVSLALKASSSAKHDPTHETCIVHSLRGEGFDASEDGTGRGTPLVPVAFSCKDHGADAGDLAPTLRAMGHGDSHANAGGQLAVAFDTTQVTSPGNYSNPKPGDPCHPLASGAHAPVVAMQERMSSSNPDAGPNGKGWSDEGVAFTLERRQTPQAIQHGMVVRRLTPRECERLQGFEDDYTLIPWRGRPAEHCPDGPRYKSIGNSQPVPVMRWIGGRIDQVDALIERVAQ